MSNALVSQKQVGDVVIAYIVPTRLVDDLDIFEVFNAVTEILEQGNAKLVLHFGGVEFLSSSALGKLVTLGKKVKAVDGALALCSIRDKIWEAFVMTGLNGKFSRYEDETEALARI